jgi:hypothetical protein
MRVVFLSSRSGGGQEKSINPPEEWDFRLENSSHYSRFPLEFNGWRAAVSTLRLETGAESWDM